MWSKVRVTVISLNMFFRPWLKTFYNKNDKTFTEMLNRIKAMTFYIKKGKTWTSLWHHNHHNSGETVVIVFSSIRISMNSVTRRHTRGDWWVHGLRQERVYFSTAHSLSGVCWAYGSLLFRHRRLGPPESTTHQRLHHQRCQNTDDHELLPSCWGRGRGSSLRVPSQVSRSGLSDCVQIRIPGRQPSPLWTCGLERNFQLPETEIPEKKLLT